MALMALRRHSLQMVRSFGFISDCKARGQRRDCGDGIAVDKAKTDKIINVLNMRHHVDTPPVLFLSFLKQ